MKLSIVILSWNVAPLLEGCLRSLSAACADWWAYTEVIVVDNASTDNSVDMVRSTFPDVRLIALPENLGFTAGNNAGISEAQGEYIYLLNPDTVCFPDSIAALCEYMEAHPEVGIAGPRLLNADGTTQSSRRRFPTLATALVESTPLQPLFRNKATLRHFYMEDQPDEGQYVDWLSGAALLCRREMLDQIGPFDPGFFMFSEEIDLCKRAADAGWRVTYVPTSQITHFGGGSTDQAVAGRHINFNTSKARYFELHEGRATGQLLRLYLLTTYIAQSISEGAKWLLGHKRPMRGERLKMYAHILRSGLRTQITNYELRITKVKADPVLIITGEFPPARGGVGDYTNKLATALQQKGIATKVLTQKPTDVEIRNQKSEIRNSALRLRRITFNSTLAELKRTRARIAHIQYQTGAYQMRPTANVLPLLLKRAWGRPTVVTFHDLLVPYLFPKAGPVREWANKLMARSATAVIATNEADASRLEAWGVGRVELIPIGSNIQNDPPHTFDREAWRAQHNVSPNTSLLAYFGFLNNTKGLDSLLRTLARLNSQQHDRYRLMMVGGGLGSSDPTNRATAAALNDLARDLGVADNLIWTGYLEPQEVSAALLSADIAVLPFADGATFRRGSLLAVLEHGLPLVTTTLGNQPPKRGPQLIDNENALLVQVGDEDAITHAIEHLSEDPNLRARLAQGATQLAQHFSWDAIAEKHIALYNSLTSNVI